MISIFTERGGLSSVTKDVTGYESQNRDSSCRTSPQSLFVQKILRTLIETLHFLFDIDTRPTIWSCAYQLINYKVHVLINLKILTGGECYQYNV